MRKTNFLPFFLLWLAISQKLLVIHASIFFSKDSKFNLLCDKKNKHSIRTRIRWEIAILRKHAILRMQISNVFKRFVPFSAKYCKTSNFFVDFNVYLYREPSFKTSIFFTLPENASNDHWISSKEIFVLHFQFHPWINPDHVH